MNNFTSYKLLNTFIIIIIYLVFSYIFIHFVIKLIPIAINGYYEETLVSVIIQFCFLLFPTLYFINKAQNSNNSVSEVTLQFNKSLNLNFDYKLILLSLVVILLLQFSNAYYFEFMQSIFKYFGYIDIIDIYKESALEQSKLIKNLNIYFMVLSFAIIPSIAEETLFRGYLLLGENKLVGNKVSINFILLVSSFVFALLHFNILFFPIYLIFGLLLGYNYIKTQNLYQSILLHFVNNLIVIINIKYFQ